MPFHIILKLSSKEDALKNVRKTQTQCKEDAVEVRRTQAQCKEDAEKVRTQKSVRRAQMNMALTLIRYIGGRVPLPKPNWWKKNHNKITFQFLSLLFCHAKFQVYWLNSCEVTVTWGAKIGGDLTFWGNWWKQTSKKLKTLISRVNCIPSWSVVDHLVNPSIYKSQNLRLKKVWLRYMPNI